MLLRIEATDLPGNSCGPSPDSPGGYQSIHVALQGPRSREDLLGLTPADADSATWTAEIKALDSEAGVDLRGPVVQGRRGARFFYLSWGTVDAAGTFTLFRRAKLMADGIPDDVMAAARSEGVLVGRLGLTDDRGNPRCAAVRPPVITWTAASA